MSKDREPEPLSFPAEIANLLPATREWMRARGYIEYIIEDGETKPRLTPKGTEWINKHAPRSD